jgi:hypothetical protein
MTTPEADPDPVKIAAENEAALVARLKEARTIYDQDKQMGCAAALETVLLYLWTKDIPVRLQEPFAGLLGAIHAAKEGNSDPHTEVSARKRDAPRKLINEAFIEVRAAVGVTLLLDAGDVSLDWACSKVAGVCSMSADEIKDVRKRLTRKHGKARAEARDLYDRLLREERARPEITKAQKAEMMLNSLRESKVSQTA